MPPTPTKLVRHRRRLAAQERSRYLDDKTDGGAEVWDFFLALMRDPEATVADRKDAAKWISEHSSAGKVADRTEVEHIDDSVPEVDYSHLSFDQARELEAHLTAAAKLLNPAPIEAPIAELPATFIDVPSDEAE